MKTPTTSRSGESGSTAGPPHRSPARLVGLRRLTILLDSSLRIPGTGFRFGLDPIIGLVPWIGDAIGAVLSASIVFEAARLGVSRGTIARMLLNIAVETVLGVIPVAGDIFDAAWKANTRNLKLFEQQIEEPERAGRMTRAFWLKVVLGMLGSLVVMLILAALLLQAALALLSDTGLLTR